MAKRSSFSARNYDNTVAVAWFITSGQKLQANGSTGRRVAAEHRHSKRFHFRGAPS
jgi:hypothetical protein